MGERKQWEEIERLGGGGQSNVFLERRPERSSKRRECLDVIRAAIDGDKRGELATAIWTYARPDSDSELGALKAFKISSSRGIAPPPGSEADEAVRRLENEINSLAKGRLGLPKLLDSDLAARWLVTEFFAEGTIERAPEKYKGDAFRALKAFRSLVKTAASLHEERLVHRDIKPANVFIRRDDDLVLGDFGIVFVPDQAERLTQTNERVGPRDYMPPWGDLGERLKDVRPNFDVYMLGKLLWCMVSGRQKLPREFQRRPGFNLVEAFPNDPAMEMINSILDLSVVEDESKCLQSGGELLKIVDRYLSILGRGGQLLSDGIRRTCRVCGEGTYLIDSSRVIGQSLYDLASRPVGAFYTEYFVCDACGHLELFRTKRRIG
jgi:serine/threonine protein kinase